MENKSFLLLSWRLLKKPAVTLALRVVVSGFLLMYLVWLSAFTGIVQAFNRIKPVYLLGFFLLYILSVSLQALRWKYLLKAWGVERKFHILFNSIMAGLFLNNFLPGSLGGDVYRIFTAGRDTGKVEAIGATIFYERLLSYGTLVIMGLIVLSIRADLSHDWLFWLLLGGALFGLLTLSAISSIPIFKQLSQSFMNRYPLARKLRLMDWLNSFQFKVHHPVMLVGIFFVSFVIQFVTVLSFRLVALAIQLPVTLNDLVLFIPLLYLATLLPLSFNGIGVRESVFIVFASRWGIASVDGVAFSLTVFALSLAGSLVGGIIYWFDRPLPDNENSQNGIQDKIWRK